MARYQTRRNLTCPDGWEHKMPNGNWMCGRSHSMNERANTKNTRKRYQKGSVVNGEFQGPGEVDPSLGSGTRDDVPALLTAGEYVVSAPAVKAVGVPFLDKLNKTGTTRPGSKFNSGELPPPARFNRGGMVKKRYANGNLVTNNGRNNMPNKNAMQRIDNSMRRTRRFHGGKMHAKQNIGLQSNRPVGRRRLRRVTGGTIPVGPQGSSSVRNRLTGPSSARRKMGNPTTNRFRLGGFARRRGGMSQLPSRNTRRGGRRRYAVGGMARNGNGSNITLGTYKSTRSLDNNQLGHFNTTRRR